MTLTASGFQLRSDLPKWQRQALAFCLARIDLNMANLESFPERTDGSQWVCVDNGGWVGGHWVGLLWLAYACTNLPKYREAAYSWAERLAPRQYDASTHDLGFLFELSHVLGYELTGDKKLKAPALQAAETLSQRFNHKGGFFQAWGELNASEDLRGRAIVDTMMNLDLLFWARYQSGNSNFASMAVNHAQTVVKHQVRSDYSTAHVIDFNPDTGEFLKQDTHQGLNSQSCWSRGQSWAIYGFCDCYRATGLHLFLETARHLAEYALDNLPEDRVPFWDYRSLDIANDARDSSAASILSAGLINLALVEPDIEKQVYWLSQSRLTLKSLWDNYSSRATIEPSILIHGTRSRPHELFDHGLIYGDYYFMEALVNLGSVDLENHNG